MTFNEELIRQVQGLKERRIIVADIEISKRTGFPKSAISSYLSGKIKASKNFVNKFTEVYKDELSQINGYQNKGRDFNKVAEDAAPYLSDIDAVAGKQDISDTDISEYKTGLISIPDFKNVTCYVNVSGSSQYPKYIAGDIIALRQIFDFTEIQLGQMYVIVTPENRVLKMVRKAKDEKKNILLVSENSKYDSYEIPRNKIRAMFLVLGKITKDVL